MFYLGNKSLKELKGVDSNLIAIVKLAIQHTTQDFAVFDGLRTLEEQKEYVKRGVSKTLKSKHLEGKAVDLIPYINGKLRWEWNPIYVVAKYVRNAAKELNVDLRWGGAWDINFTNSYESPAKIVEDYIKRRRAKNKKAFIDGPHFELLEK